MTKYYRWTEKEIKLLKKLYKTKTDYELSEILNHPKDSITQKRHQLRLTKYNITKKKLWSKKDIQFIQDNYLEMSDEEIAVELRHSENSVQTKRCSMKLYRKPVYVGVPKTNRILSDILQRQRKAGFLEQDNCITQ